MDYKSEPTGRVLSERSIQHWEQRELLGRILYGEAFTVQFLKELTKLDVLTEQPGRDGPCPQLARENTPRQEPGAQEQVRFDPLGGKEQNGEHEHRESRETDNAHSESPIGTGDEVTETEEALA
jgi:hypothetical protein